MAKEDKDSTVIIKVEPADKKTQMRQSLKRTEGNYAKCYFVSILTAAFLLVIAIVSVYLSGKVDLNEEDSRSILTGSSSPLSNINIKSKSIFNATITDKAERKPNLFNDRAPSDWPFGIFIARREFNSTSLFKVSCSGTLINRRTIITAARCCIATRPLTMKTMKRTTNLSDDEYNYVYDDSYDITLASNVTVYLGVRYLSDLDDLDNVPSYIVTRGVRKITIHEQWYRNSAYHDIGLLTLDSDVDLAQRNIEIAYLPRRIGLVDTHESFRIGWKSPNEKKRLMYAETIVEKCSTNELNREHVCAKNACIGYAGSGLYTWKRINGGWHKVLAAIQLGEDSDNCSQKEYVDFTNTSFYLNWIRHKISI